MLALHNRNPIFNQLCVIVSLLSYISETAHLKVGLVLKGTSVTLFTLSTSLWSEPTSPLEIHSVFVPMKTKHLRT